MIADPVDFPEGTDQPLIESNKSSWKKDSDMLMAASTPTVRRRTAVAVAANLSAASSELVTLQQQLDAIRQENIELNAQIAVLQARRLKDQDRLALIERSRSALEANRASQAARTRSAIDALGEKDSKIKQLEATSRPSDPLSASRARSDAASTTLFDKLIAALSLTCARSAARQRRWARAEVHYNAVLLVRDEPRLWGQLGNVLREQGDYVGSAAAYRRVIALAPQNGEAHIMLGISAAGLGEAARAEESYRTALRLDPGLISKFPELAYILKKDGE